jgi:hypothetical protein
MAEWMPEGSYLPVAVVGTGIIAVGLFQLVRSNAMSWSLLALVTLGVAMAGASVFSEVSAGRDGVRIITIAQATSAVAKAVQANSSAIEEVSEALRELRTIVAALSPSDREGRPLPQFRLSPDDLRRLSDAQLRLENLTERTDALAAASRANQVELQQQIERLDTLAGPSR